MAEVNNTFGERHCYLLTGPTLSYGREMVANKVFHVSPFCHVQGSYRFRFMRTAQRCVARVDHDDDHGPLLLTSVSGRFEPLTVPESLLRLSVGVEDVEDLWADLSTALSALGGDGPRRS